MRAGGHLDGRPPAAVRRLRPVRTLTFAAATTALALTAAVPAGAQYEEPAEIAVSSSSVDCGEGLEVTGRHWMSASGVDLTLEPANPNAPSRSLADDVPVGADGTFAVDVTIPEDAHPGANDVVATGTDANGDPARVEARIVIQGDECSHGGPQSSTTAPSTTTAPTTTPSTTAAAAPTTGGAGPAGGGSLPFTGSGSTRELVLFVAGLVVVGSGLTAVARRRRRLA